MKVQSISLDDCIIFGGYKNKKGYGYKWRTDKIYTAHRLAYMDAYGEIPDGLHVLHRCDNPSCINPDHLFLGTNYDNVMDRKAKGRGRSSRNKGESNGSAKITSQDAEKMRELCDSGYQQKELVEIFGLSKASVCRIINNKAWQ